MKPSHILAAALSIALLPAGAVAQTATSRQGSTEAMAEGAKRVRITYENLTMGQVFSPSVFMSHNASAPPLFKEGEKASVGLRHIAEEGNAGPLLSEEVVKKIGGPFGTAVMGISTLPGQKRTVDIEVTREHPMISGAWMLVMTNDGFSGVNGVNAYGMSEAKTLDLVAYDAGTEKNNEKKDYLVALKGDQRDPEDGVVTIHKGIRGDADAPADWKWDTTKPVARITITPITTMAATR